MKTAGIVLLLVGILALAYEGFTYTTREKVIDIGPIEVIDDTQKTIPISPIVGGALVIAGAALLYAGGKTGSKV